MVKISAQLSNSPGSHQVTLRTNATTHSITIPPKETGAGSSANGGELLFLALATCYCNDIYREAAKRSIVVRKVEVEVTGEFDTAPGSRAENILYNATVEAEASQAEITELMHHTDTVAEIQKSLRQGVAVVLNTVTAISV